MSFRILKAGIVSATLVVAAATASAQEAVTGPLVVWDPVLAASVERLATGSASWRDAIGAVAATGRRALLVTPDRLKTPMEAGTLAQVYPLADDQSRVETVVVVVNLDLLQKLSGLPVTATDYEDDVDRILAHEVYGHVIPILLAGTMSGHCPDPAIGQSALTACAIQRENIIRREMRMGPRLEYGRESLALARRFWH
jgi:hypothetical protein